MSKVYKQCQSCGMPRKKEEDFGLEQDGSKSPLYCSLCYADGALISPDMTLQEMETIVDDALKEMGSGRFFRWMARKQLPTLLRWKKK